MNKPLTIKVRDFNEELVKLINSSELPALILKQELEKVYNELSRMEEEEIKEYEESIKEKENTNDNI